MKVEHHIPVDLLKPFIRTFMLMESEHGDENFVLPETSLVLSIRYKGRVSIKENGKINCLPAIVLSGIRKTPRLIKYEKQTANLLIVFEPCGATAFFNEPLNKLFGQSLQAAYLKFDEMNITSRLLHMDDNRKKIAFIEKLLLSRLLQPLTDALMTKAVQKIKAVNGHISIKLLADQMCLSQDAFEKRFRRSVGTTPKHFSTIIKLRHAIGSHQPGRSLTDTALVAGYYDQAHFIKDFRAFTGKTPRRFFLKALFAKINDFLQLAARVAL